MELKIFIKGNFYHKKKKQKKLKIKKWQEQNKHVENQLVVKRQ
jgi:ABC-type lipoprotein release transport system permease subunit